VGNGIRFDKGGFMYIADYPRHNILKVDPSTKEISVFTHEPRMNQPNDIAISPVSESYMPVTQPGETPQEVMDDRQTGKSNLAGGEYGYNQRD
jgi:hypothetical protein